MRFGARAHTRSARSEHLERSGTQPRTDVSISSESLSTTALGRHDGAVRLRSTPLDAESAPWNKSLARFAGLTIDAGWSSLVARRAHNPKVAGSNPAPATE